MSTKSTASVSASISNDSGSSTPPSATKSTESGSESPARRYLKYLRDMKSALDVLAKDRKGLDGFLELEKENLALKTELESKKSHFRTVQEKQKSVFEKKDKQITNLEELLLGAQRAKEELADTVVDKFEDRLKKHLYEYSLLEQQLEDKVEDASELGEKHARELQAREEEIEDRHRGAMGTKDAQIQGLQEKLRASHEKLQERGTEIEKLNNFCYATETMLKGKQFELDAVQGIQRRRDERIGLEPWDTPRIEAFSARIQKLANDSHEVLKEFFWNHPIFKNPPANVCKLLEESTFSNPAHDSTFPVVMVDSDIGRLSVLARAENIFATFLCKIFESCPIPRLSENDSATKFNREIWSIPMKAMTSALAKSDPYLEAEWRALSWTALTIEEDTDPVNKPAEFIECQLRRMMKQCRPFTEKAFEANFRSVVRPLLEEAYELWSQTFFHRDRIVAKMPDPLDVEDADVDDLLPLVDHEYAEVEPTRSISPRSDRTFGTRSTLGLWPEIFIARTHDDLEVLFPGKILQSDSNFVLRARIDHEKFLETQRVREHQRSSEKSATARRTAFSSAGTVPGTPRRYSVSGSDNGHGHLGRTPSSAVSSRVPGAAMMRAGQDSAAAAGSVSAQKGERGSGLSGGGVELGADAGKGTEGQ